jgi:hypothetical protein
MCRGNPNNGFRASDNHDNGKNVNRPRVGTGEGQDSADRNKITEPLTSRSRMSRETQSSQRPKRPRRNLPPRPPSSSCSCNKKTPGQTKPHFCPRRHQSRILPGANRDPFSRYLLLAGTEFRFRSLVVRLVLRVLGFRSRISPALLR